MRKIAVKVFELGHLWGRPSHWRAIWRDARGGGQRLCPDPDHLQAAMDWLCRAQDVTGCGGVSAGYFFRRGWMPPYPEVTGYIIPTFLRWAGPGQGGVWVERALRMGDWEIDIQLPSGAVRGGIGLREYPVVFNTGQVVLGWVALYGATAQDRFLDAAVRAADWLLSVQDEDGKWSRHTYMDAPHAYHTRVAWSLLEVWACTGCEDYRMAAERHIRWVLKERGENGWFRYMGFAPQEVPLTHTIAYTLRGLLESSFHLSGDAGGTVLETVEKTAEKIRVKYESLPAPAHLPASLDENLESRDAHSCLTGNAQLAIVWLKLCGLNKDVRFATAAQRLLDQVKQTHSLDSGHPGIRGGIAGSHPLWGRYVPWAYLSWATKFFVDGLVLKQELNPGT